MNASTVIKVPVTEFDESIWSIASLLDHSYMQVVTFGEDKTLLQVPTPERFKNTDLIFICLISHRKRCIGVAVVHHTTNFSLFKILKQLFRAKFTYGASATSFINVILSVCRPRENQVSAPAVHHRIPTSWYFFNSSMLYL